MGYLSAIGFLWSNFGKFTTTSFFLLLLFFTAFSQSLEQRSPLPFLKEFGVRFVSADQENYNITASLLRGDTPPSFFSSFPWLWHLLQLLNVFGNLWFLYHIFKFLQYGILLIVGPTITPIGLFLMSSLLLVCFHIIASLFFTGTPETPVEFLRWIPLSGTLYAFTHYEVFLPTW